MGWKTVISCSREIKSHFEAKQTSCLDWRAKLEDNKGVYLTTDIHTGRRHIGSAYGDLGTWSRWRQYIDTEHGGNVELTRLVREQGLYPIVMSISIFPARTTHRPHA